MNPTPLTVVGGYLGAGKTTLLNHVLRQADGLRLAVLVNDFGAINIDAGLIERHEGSTISLSNGCVCCAIGDSLVETLASLMRSKTRPDHIVIEASGVADPGRIAEIAYLDPGLRLQGVLVVADCEQVRAQGRDKYVGDTVRRQIEAGDLVVLTKTDLCDAPARRASELFIASVVPGRPVVPAEHGKAPIELLLGLDDSRWGAFLRAGPIGAHHPAKTFATATFENNRPFRLSALRDWLDEGQPGLLRAKGWVLTDEGSARPAILHVVGRRWDLGRSVSSPPLEGRQPRTRMVAIGLTGVFDLAHLRERLSAALAPA